MIERFKGVTATLTDWNNTSRIIPSEVWAVVVIEGTVDAPTEIGLKLGIDASFANTPWLYDPRVLDNKIDAPDVTNPSSVKFLAQDGNYYEIEVAEGLTLDEVYSDIDDKDLEIPTKSEVEWLREQVFTVPTIASFTSSSGMLGYLERSTVIEGSITFTYTLTEKANIASVNLSVSHGTWSGTGTISLTSSSKVKITLSGSLTVADTDTITYELKITDTYGNSSSAYLYTRFTPKVYYGMTLSQVITSLDDIVGKTSFLFTDYPFTLSFAPGSTAKYPILLIPASVDKDDMNIVNKNVEGIAHSFGMNSKGSSTQYLYSFSGDILYHAYVTDETSSGNLTCIVN